MMHHSSGTRLFALSGIVAIALAAASARPAEAEFFILVEEVSSGASVLIEDNGALDTNLLNPGVITVDTALLNLELFDFQFDDLGAFTNSLTGEPFSDTPGILRQTGGVARTSQVGEALIRITAFADNYNFPNLDPLALNSSASDSFTETGEAALRTFQSFLITDGTETAGNLLTLDPPAGLGPFAESAEDSVGGIGGILPYALRSVTEITAGPVTLTRTPSDQFTGATAVVPEPSALALLGLGVPALVCYRRRRRNRSA